MLFWYLSIVQYVITYHRQQVETTQQSLGLGVSVQWGQCYCLGRWKEFWAWVVGMVVQQCESTQRH